MLSTATAAKYNSLWIMLSLACACGVLYVLALTHRRDRDRARPDADPERIQVDRGLGACQDRKYTSGEWVTVLTEDGAKTECGLPTDYPLGSESAKHYFGGVILPWTRFCWNPFECDLIPFSQTDSCRVIAEATKGSAISILFVGDSVTHQMYEAFFMLHGGKGQPTPLFISKVQPVCDGNVKIQFVRNDYISTNSGIEACKGESNSLVDRVKLPHMICADWTKLVPKAAVVLMNSGAHVIPAAQYQEIVRNTTDWLKEHAHGKRIIFRTTPPGHAGCSLFDVPVTADAKPAPVMKLETKLVALKYGFDKVRARNEIAKRMFGNLTGAAILDVDHLTTLRPDGHRAEVTDCLHYYLPGVVDVWVQLLYNMLAGKLS